MKRLFVVLFLIMALGLFNQAIAQTQTPVKRDEVVNRRIPADSGMYVQAGEGFNKILGQIVTFTRTGSLLVSKLTVGIKAKKQNIQLLGPHAQTVVADSTPVFYFIPPKQEADAGVNAGDLVLIRLEEKAERRQFEVGAEGAWRASEGISLTHQIQLDRSEVSSGAYSITPTVGLKKGEYALYLARGEGMKAYVYDFSVNPEYNPRAPTLAKTSEPGNTGPNSQETLKTRPNALPSNEVAVVEISSDPIGAEIEIDGKFVGNTPSSVGLTAGEHTVHLSKHHFKNWERTVKISTGKISIAADLDSLVADQMPPTANELPSAAIVRDPIPTNSIAHLPEEDQLGISFNGSPTIKHDGLEVSAVRSKEPADHIGIQAGDIILAVDNRYIYTIDEFRAILSKHDRGTPIAIRYRHDRLTYENSVAPLPKDTTALK